MRIYIQSEGMSLGPAPIEEIEALLPTGLVKPSDWAHYEGSDAWQPLASMPEFRGSSSAEISVPPTSRSKSWLAIVRKCACREAFGQRRLRGASAWLAIAWLFLGVCLLGYFVSYECARHRVMKLATVAQIPARFTISVAPHSAPEATSRRPALTPGAIAVSKAFGPAESRRRPVDERPPAPAKSALDRSDHGPVPSEFQPVPLARVSLDPQMTPFGTHDVAIIKAIRQRWFELLQESGIRGRAGKIVMSFREYADGHIANVHLDNPESDSILAYLCQKTVLDTAPHGVWPPTYRRLVRKNYREMRFTFNYQDSFITAHR